MHTHTRTHALTHTHTYTSQYVQVTFTKHEGDFVFMSLIGDHPPTRIQPPSRTMHDYDVTDFAICRLEMRS